MTRWPMPRVSRPARVSSPSLEGPLPEKNTLPSRRGHPGPPFSRGDRCLLWNKGACSTRNRGRGFRKPLQPRRKPQVKTWGFSRSRPASTSRERIGAPILSLSILLRRCCLGKLPHERSQGSSPVATRRLAIIRGDNSLSIGVEHSRKDPCFLSAPRFLLHGSGNVHSGRDRSGGDTRDSNNRSPRIGQIERRATDLWKEQQIPRLLTVFVLTLVSYTQRNSSEKSYDDDDDGTPPGRHRSPKRTKHNSEKQGSPRTNGGSTESP